MELGVVHDLDLEKGYEREGLYVLTMYVVNSKLGCDESKTCEWIVNWIGGLLSKLVKQSHVAVAVKPVYWWYFKYNWENWKEVWIM